MSHLVRVRNGREAEVRTMEYANDKMGVGVATGIAMGAAIGVAMDNVAAGLAIGAGVGAALGAAWSANPSEDAEPEPGDEDRQS